MSNNYLKKPLTIEQIEAMVDEQNYIEGVVAVKDSELLNLSYEEFLDLLGEKLTGSQCLQEINEVMIGCEPENNLIIYRVSGDATSILDLNY